HTRSYGDWSSDVCSSDLLQLARPRPVRDGIRPITGFSGGDGRDAVGGVRVSARESRRRRHLLLARSADPAWVERASYAARSNWRSEERRVGKRGSDWGGR